MNETEYVALIFILKENQKKGKENKKNYSQRKPEQKWENIKKNWKKLRLYSGRVVKGGSR